MAVREFYKMQSRKTKSLTTEARLQKQEERWLLVDLPLGNLPKSRAAGVSRRGRGWGDKGHQLRRQLRRRLNLSGQLGASLPHTEVYIGKGSHLVSVRRGLDFKAEVAGFSSRGRKVSFYTKEQTSYKVPA